MTSIYLAIIGTYLSIVTTLLVVLLVTQKNNNRIDNEKWKQEVRNLFYSIRKMYFIKHGKR